MNIKNFFSILSASFLATFLRFYIRNNFLISVFGSFLFGFVIAKEFSKSKNKILLTGFCSSFTSFSSFIHILHKLINQENLITTFMYANIIIILNLLMMSFGFAMSRKIN